ncbi:MAG: integration host factor subunit beta [Phycisphaerae bacterium]|nr:integration host factor subunit beta [Phycisphaerae bacterium]
MATVTKKDLIDRITTRTKLKRLDVKNAVQEMLEQIIVELQKGNRLELRDFGVFEVKQRKPRVAQNPKTLERVEVPARKTVKFKVGRLMREGLGAAARQKARAAAAAKNEG